ncbi:MAG: hypothetical protein H6658_05905 [Ardenticatenaceae bacterium]|nr:hypothetical protein [Ardenticatenaceae bacterium]
MTRQDVTWEDSGFDCDHCGGEILKRSHRTIPEKEQYFQCSQCGCRWSIEGEVLRVGDGPFCQNTGYQRQSLPADKRLWWLAAGVGLLLAFWFGGTAIFSFLFTLVRFLIPLGILVLIIMAIYWLGRQQDFWQ